MKKNEESFAHTHIYSDKISRVLDTAYHVDAVGTVSSLLGTHQNGQGVFYLV